MSINRVYLVGQLDNIKHGTFKDGKDWCNFSLLTTKQWTDKKGKQQVNTEWHSCVSYGVPAKFIYKHAKKGETIFIEGQIKSFPVKDQDHKQKKVQVNRVEMQV